MASKRILIVDDETLARNRIRRFLSELNVDAEIDEANTGVVAIEKIQSVKPDIVFLDIQMPRLNGFEVLQQLEHKNFQLIFQTAFDEYAIQAFEENACDYLLKPFSIERFQKAINKAFDLHAQTETLKKVENKIRERDGSLEKLIIRQQGKMKVIDLDQIDCFVSRDHYTCIYSNGSELVSEFSLSWLEERIDSKTFIRCHRNNIVAVNQIKAIGGTNDSEIELKNGMKVPLSRNNRRAVLDLFK